MTKVRYHHGYVNPIRARRPHGPEAPHPRRARRGGPRARRQRRDADGRSGRRGGVDLSHDRLSVLPESAGAARRRPSGDRRVVAAARRRTRRCARLDSTSSSTRSRARSSRTRRNSARCFDSRSRPTRPSAPQLPLRQGRAIKWIEEALAPLRDEMSEAEVHRLALAIRSATGIEALVWLTDVAGLSRDDATELMRWSARALLQSALADRQLTPISRLSEGPRHHTISARSHGTSYHLYPRWPRAETALVLEREGHVPGVLGYPRSGIMGRAGWGTSCRVLDCGFGARKLRCLGRHGVGTSRGRPVSVLASCR